MLCLCFISCSKAATNDITSTSKTTEPLTTASSTVVSKKEATTNTNEKATTNTNEKTTTTKKESTKQKETTTKVKSNQTTVKSYTTKPNNTTTTHKQTSKVKSCTVSIECTSLLGNTEKLKPGREEYVPKDGYILKNYTYTFEKNKTVFDALEYACEKNSIILNSKPSIYGIYVAGINNLNERDCGEKSGWKYKVNGVDADRGCGYYKLSGGENIVFYYTLTA